MTPELKAKWTKSQDGVLVLEGTVMSVVYRPTTGGHFHVYQGDLRRSSHATLEYSKGEAARLYAELIEIGAAE